MTNHTTPTDKDKKLWEDLVEAHRTLAARRAAVYNDIDEPLAVMLAR